MTDLQYILNTVFKDGPLYIGLVDLNGYTGYDPTSDTMSSHAGWVEFTDYAEGTRQLWDPADPLDTYPSSLNNPAPAVINPTVDGNTYGAFLCDDDTKGGSSGQLFGPFFFQNGGRSLVAGSPFTINMTITMKRNSPWAN